MKVSTSGSDGDQCFYAMELVEGADLGAVCSRLAGSTAAEVGEDDWTAAASSAWQEQRRREQALSDGESSPLAPRVGGDSRSEPARRRGSGRPATSRQAPGRVAPREHVPASTGVGPGQLPGMSYGR